MTRELSTHEVYAQLGLQQSAFIIDVRTREELERVPRLIPGAVHFDPEDVLQWRQKVPANREVTLYSAAGRDGGSVVNVLSQRGLRVSTIAGGIGRWMSDQLPTIRIRPELGVPGGSHWVTRERPKIDRIACPWLVRRFIDPQASFFYVPAARVRAEAQALGAQPYDIADVTFSHRGPQCSFDAFLAEFELHDPVLDALAQIVRAADTATLDKSREAPGLLAISLGLSASTRDDQLLLEQAMSVYDALYAWCKTARDEPHSWPQPVANA